MLKGKVWPVCQVDDKAKFTKHLRTNIKSAHASLRIVERSEGKLEGDAGPSLAQKVKQTGHQVFCIEQIQVRERDGEG